MSRPERRSTGFTLIEVVGAFFMTMVLVTLVVGIFRENGRQRGVASEVLRVETTAAAALDLVAGDLEGALFVSPPSGRPAGEHPWNFFAEGRSELGATYLRFQTQNVPRTNLGEHASTWVDVAYFLTEEEPEDRGFFVGTRYTLWRWRSTRPPSEVARRTPDQDDEGSARVATGLADFGITFVDSEGARSEEWDSTFATADSPLPVGAEIRLSLFRDAREGEADVGVTQIPGRIHERFVALPMSTPIDVDALIAAAGDGEELACGTISDCADFDDQWFIDERESGCDGDEELCRLLDASAETCWSEIASGWPSVAAAASPECENLE